MWITNRQAREPLEESVAELGQVTLSGSETGVALAGERRGATLCGPGGYHWSPCRGDTVLVVKSGPEQAPCVVGSANVSMVKPGEVYLSVARGAGIRLRPDGSIALEGTIRLSGSLAVQGSLTVNGREV